MGHGYLELASIGTLYKMWRDNPLSVSEEWKLFFEEFEKTLYGVDGEALSPAELDFELKVWQLVWAYRQWGHLLANTNPIRKRKDRGARLFPAHYGITEGELGRPTRIAERLGVGRVSVSELIENLNRIYLGHIGFEWAHIVEQEVREWWQHLVEREWLHWQPSQAEKQLILTKLNEVEAFEEFLHVKYIGHKRFSIEGTDVFIPAMEMLVREAAQSGAEEIVFGLTHRGRLAFLACIMGKTYEEIFSEFEDIPPELPMGDGDVKYHRGYRSYRTVNGKHIYLRLLPNPSHLESVDGVVLGYVRAKGELLYGKEWRRIVPVVAHGDAAVAAQGMIYEVVQLSGLRGYRVGGTIHVVVNNQIGFTTDFDEARTSHYCTSLGTIVQAPVLHVNGDDPEAVLFCIKAAVAFRQRFGRDVWIDIVGYRKYGHNEADEPRFTQPRLYTIISEHKSVKEQYLGRLEQQGEADRRLALQMREYFWQILQEKYHHAKREPIPYKPQSLERLWQEMRPARKEDFFKSYDTTFSKERAMHLLELLCSVPEGFKLVPQAERLLRRQHHLWLEKRKLDWAGAELLAYATLMDEGFNVRLDGQDSRRGTFAHRHAVLYEAESEEEYFRFNALDTKGWFRIYNSPLSELGVLAFSYGYSLASPSTLVIWEAQFGDFANGAQVIIDQYVSSGEDKWEQMCSLVLFLPHGYEGQGPEHSSARMERFLQLCADLNMIVANCTTPASLFHLLRRQMRFPFRKPLVLFTPKSLLRHPEVISSLEEVCSGRFEEVLDDPDFGGVGTPRKVRRLLLCTGKIYYELKEAMRETKRQRDIAVVRMEQLYPLRSDLLEDVVSRYEFEEVYWVQEEPANMGAWGYLQFRRDELPVSLRNMKLIARPESASPATGFFSRHLEEQRQLIERAISL